MNLKQKLAAANAATAAKIEALKAETQTRRPKVEKPRVRVTAILGDEVMESRPLATVTRIVWPTATLAQHAEGHTCPHCRGTGRYRFHTDRSRNEKCYRCDGKGRLNTKDLQFLQARVGGRGPICEIITA